MLGPALLGPGELERGEPGSRSSGAGTSAEGAWPCRSGMSLSAFSTGFSPLNPAGLNPARSSGLLCPAGAIAYPQKGWHRPSRAIRGQSRGRGSMLAPRGGPRPRRCLQRGPEVVQQRGLPRAAPVSRSRCHRAAAFDLRGFAQRRARVGKAQSGAPECWENGIGSSPELGEARPRRRPGAAAFPEGSQLQLWDGNGPEPAGQGL